MATEKPLESVGETVFCEYYSKLSNSLPVDDVIPKLISLRVINVSDKQLIKSEKSDTLQAQSLLDIIAKKVSVDDISDFNHLLTALMETGKCNALVKEIATKLGISVDSLPSCEPSDVETAKEEGVNIFERLPDMPRITEGKVVDLIAAHWMEIGYRLDFDKVGREVGFIAEEGFRNPRNCCTIMLQTWISTDKGIKPKTWKMLLEIIRTQGYKVAHDKIKQYLEKQK